MTAPKATSKTDKREQAIRKVARDRLHIELGMEHRETEHSIAIVDLRRALEAAYDLGVKAGMS